MFKEDHISIVRQNTRGLHIHTFEKNGGLVRLEGLFNTLAGRGRREETQATDDAYMLMGSLFAVLIYIELNITVPDIENFATFANDTR